MALTKGTAITALAIMLALAACSSTSDDLKAEIDYFRTECAEYQGQGAQGREACMRYTEATMKLAEHRENKRAAAQFLRPIPKTTCQANSAGSYICY